MPDPKIKLKRSSVSGKIPSPANVPLGELALNTYDGYLYASRDVGAGTTVIAINPFRVGTGTDTYDAYFTQGNIGIGTDNPTQKLDVNGDARFRGALYDFNNVTGNPGELLTSTGSGVQWITGTTAASGQDIVTQQAGTPYYITGSDVTSGVSTAGFIDTTIVARDGKFGVGTNNPLRTLHLESSSPILRLSDSDVSSNIEITNSNGNLNFDSDSQGSGTGGTFTFTTGGTTEIVRFGASGNVGIGTNNPSETLDVNGNARFRGAIYDNNNVVGGANSVFISTGSGVIWADLTTLPTGDASTLDGLDSTQFLRSDVADTKVGVTTFQDDIFLGDNDIINLGDNQDLQIYHSSSDNNSVIQESGTGSLILAETQ